MFILMIKSRLLFQVSKNFPFFTLNKAENKLGKRT